jgi:ABC-type phosphate/phosphonate transport system ATPase subunit
MGELGTAPALSFDGVSMVFPDGTHALNETTFDVRAGEFVTVVGPPCSALLRVFARQHQVR